MGGFNDLIHKTSSRSIARFTNATLTASGKTVAVVFDCPAKTVPLYDGAVGMSAPTVTMLSADVEAMALDSGTVVDVNGISYAVIGPPEHDGAGLALLNLDEA